VNRDQGSQGYERRASPTLQKVGVEPRERPTFEEASHRARDDASLTAASCAWCRQSLGVTVRRDSRYCSQACRQAAYRLRCRRVTEASYGGSMRFAYADPPYPKRAYLYSDQPSFAGEVDHAALIASLEASRYDGWALSTSARALRDVLPLCPARARVCAWVKPQPPHVRTRGIHCLWEPVIVVDGRQLPPGVGDWLKAKPARGGGEKLIGRKPIAFAAWLFDLLGMLPGDTLEDLYPGTGIIGRAWHELSSRTSRDVTRLEDIRVSSTAARDVSSSRDVSPLQQRDRCAKKGTPRKQGQTTETRARDRVRRKRSI